MTRAITLTDLHYTFKPVTVPVEQVGAALRPWTEPWGARFVDVAEEFAAAVYAGDDEAAGELAGHLGIGWEDTPQAT
jgi:hypothetical protein